MFFFKKKPKKEEKKGPATEKEWETHLNALNADEAAAADEILKQTDHSIDTAIELLKDSKLIGTEAYEKLVHQGDQLKDIDDDLKKIRRENEKSRKSLNIIASIFGGLKNKLTACFHPDIENEDWKPRPEDPPPSGPKPTHPVETPSHASSTPLFDLFKKTEQGLDTISGLTNDLQGLALQIQKELKYQDEILDSVLEDADKALREMRALNKKAHEMEI